MVSFLRRWRLHQLGRVTDRMPVADLEHADDLSAACEPGARRAAALAER
jgi:hypothetical protein